MTKLKIAQRIRRLRKGFKQGKNARQEICKPIECLDAINEVFETNMTTVRNFLRLENRIGKRMERMGEFKFLLYNSIPKSLFACVG